MAENRLPTKDQINEITDLVALNQIRDDVDWHRGQIETRLEFGDGDDDWAHRAMSALTAHRICVGNIDKRIRQLSKGLTKPAQVEHVSGVLDKKIAKNEAHAARLKAEALAKQNKAAQINAESAAKIAKAIEDTHMLGCLLKALRGEVSEERFSRIMDRASEMMARKIAHSGH